MPFPLTLTTTAFDRSNLKVVWDLRLYTDPERPTLIICTASTYVVRDTQYPGFCSNPFNLISVSGIGKTNLNGSMTYDSGPTLANRFRSSIPCCVITSIAR